MNNTGPQNQAISDDQELASVLKGMQQQNHALSTTPGVSDQASSFEETPLPTAATPAGPAISIPSLPPLPAPAAEPAAAEPAAVETPAAPAVDPAPAAAPAEPAAEPVAAPAVTETPAPVAAPAAAEPAPERGGELDTIKREALEELRPLVGKLNLPPKEKFDTMLLIIRSTDDKSLLDPAHEAARAITDEEERAQALLDIIKEIDYFSSQQ
ncbi:hypothetical protein JNJ66_06845 [Candidatus Saccharibacteria bacterium]|nr:hypothetical protein [Candidatus Saccharibacteria bacterium]